MNINRYRMNSLSTILLVLVALFSHTDLVFSAAPVISNYDADGTITWLCSTNGVSEYRIEGTTNLTSPQWTSYSPPIPPTGSTMSASIPRAEDCCFYRVLAVLSPGTNAPGAGMVLVPAGDFSMGNGLAGEGEPAELPVHTVWVFGFYMDVGEITWSQWMDVYQWATNKGYEFTNPGDGKQTNHPVQYLSWFDSVKWCNARSEKENRTPVYYTSPDKSEVYRAGELNINNDCVDWSCNGYRLPTEAEWENAARGGLEGDRFPWGATIQHAQANYYSDTNNYSYDVSPTIGYHSSYTNGALPYTSPVGSFPSNGYGLYDMAGNVWEWCWDGSDAEYYTNSPAIDPHGPLMGLDRIIRGGSFEDNAYLCRTANRGTGSPDTAWYNIGFRTVIAVGHW